MKKFSVIIPEKREEVVMVEWEIEAENQDEIKKMIDDGTFIDNAEYIETKESRWGFEVVEIYTNEAEIEEVKNAQIYH